MLFSTIKLIARPLFRVLFSVEHQGVENVPEEGAVIIAGNHPSYLDPLLVGLPIRRTIRFMAWDALFKVPLLGKIIKAVGAFPSTFAKAGAKRLISRRCAFSKAARPWASFPKASVRTRRRWAICARAWPGWPSSPARRSCP